MSLNAGDTIGDYQVIGILGAGGMGKVYQVRNVISDRIEAMKILLPNLEEDPELADRFIREIKVQASLDHPNIAGLHTAQRAGGKLLMLMEFVEGETIEAKLRRGPIPLRDGVAYIRQVLAALAFAHARGVVHRDIKPANMMVTPAGQVKLMDFGIARVAADRKLTATGRTVGSLYYMSPEQINGAADLDGRSDLYSLGVSLYEVVTGRRPFQGDSDYSIMAAHLQAKPVPPIQIDPRLPPALNDVILTAIAKDPAQRFQSADAFRRALESVLEEAPAIPAARPAAAPPPVPVLPPPPAPAEQKPGGSRRLLYMAAGSLATIAVLVFAAMQVPKWRQTEAGGPVPAEARPAPASPEAEAAAPEPAPAAPEAVPAAPLPSVETGTPVRQAPPVRRSTPSAPAPAATEQPPAAQAEPVRAAPPPPAAAPAPAPALQTAPAAPPAAELRALRERMMMLGARLGPLNTTIQNMQRRQAAQGLGMRQDVLSSQQRAAYHLDEAESALRAGDASAKKSLDSAEREIENLERFLGR